jgi:hypothetical protein
MYNASVVLGRPGVIVDSNGIPHPIEKPVYTEHEPLPKFVQARRAGMKHSERFRLLNRSNHWRLSLYEEAHFYLTLTKVRGDASAVTNFHRANLLSP